MAKKKAAKKTSARGMTKKATKKTAKKTAAGASGKTTKKAATTKAPPSPKPRTHKAGSREKTVTKKAVKKAGRRVPSGGKRPTPGQMVFYFGSLGTDGDGQMRDLLGGKGANLAEMTSIGLPVPPGFTITTETCERYYAGGKRLPHGLMNECHRNMAFVQKETGREFGNLENPLLVSVRSGAAVSMPGMMDTVLNLGLNEESVEGLAKQTGNRWFAYDALRRLVGMFGNVVMGVDIDRFESALTAIRDKHEAETDADIPEEGMVEAAETYLEVYRKSVGDEFPQNPFKQLEMAIEAVFKSWNAERAVAYRRINSIVGLPGTAVNIQAMVFGNMGDDSGTGVAFTRNPSTGEDRLFGEFLVNAQGEDVVAGIRTPRPASEMQRWDKKSYQQLLDIKASLETHYKDAQDIEFTIERGKLWMLQTRTAKRTGASAIKIACDMVKEGLITEDEALLRVPAGDLVQLLLPSFADKARKAAGILCKGLPASPGAAVGKPAFSAEEVLERSKAGEAVILVRRETSPEDIEGMHAADGILTSTGGMTSHAAVVARGWGKTCVVGAGDLRIDPGEREMRVGTKAIGPDDLISVDGTTGEVMLGEIERVKPGLSTDYQKIMRWADKHRTLVVRANCDTPDDAAVARDFGAQGIGLCRTEHMFFEDGRIHTMRQMILAETPEQRAKALEQLRPLQRDDFIGMFEAMKGNPVTVRLLDPPLHEFLPSGEREILIAARKLGVEAAQVERRVHELHEQNPMLGHRGCRVAVSYPEILHMQVSAIAEATIECLKRKVRAQPEIMLPLIGTKRELAWLRERCLEAIHEVRREQDYAGRLDIKIGTMIEVPRAAVAADEIAEAADFFSFGTNDLTQLTFGYSRDDIMHFLPAYIAAEILDADPFQTLDVGGVGRLVAEAVQKGRASSAEIKIGVCGEHGGDPASVQFFHDAGVDYVSCSAFRVPIARLAAAQAALRGKLKGAKK